MIQLLSYFGAEVNARDYLGRTPIYLAAKEDNEEAIKLLLGLKADPFIKDLRKLSAEDVAQDEKMKVIIRKGKMFQLTDAWSIKQKRQVVFELDGKDYFKGDKYQFELDREASPAIRTSIEKKRASRQFKPSGSMILSRFASKERKRYNKE
mmetsp:Transcript_30897/g.30384  ORF Transcript_30897/g.30384 Transcript_30897/m.30384 type:complete len:151 (+) Transcript_30897:71-523(+)